MWKWIKRQLGVPDDGDVAEKANGIERRGTSENSAMLALFYKSLEATYHQLDPLPNENSEPVRERIAKLLNIDQPENTKPPARTWDNAYQVELMMVRVRPASSLETEIQRCINGLEQHAKSLSDGYATELKDLRGKTADEDIALKRALLARVQNDWHWKSKQRYLRRLVGQTYVKRSLVFLVTVLVVYGAAITLSAWSESSEWGYAGLLIAGCAGMVGAIFSIMTGRGKVLANPSLEATSSETSIETVILRLGVGGTGALMLYFFFDSGLIGGQAFPKLSQLGFTGVDAANTASNTQAALAVQLAELKSAASDLSKATMANPELVTAVKTQLKAIEDIHQNVVADAQQKLGSFVPNADLSKLIVWSILAGFSEKLVPTMLNRVEAQSEAAK